MNKTAEEPSQAQETLRHVIDALEDERDLNISTIENGKCQFRTLGIRVKSGAQFVVHAEKSEVRFAMSWSTSVRSSWLQEGAL